MGKLAAKYNKLLDLYISEKDRAETAFARLQKQLRELRHKESDASKRLAETEARLTKRDAECTSLKEELANTKAKHESHINRLETHLDSVQGRLRALKTKASNAARNGSGGSGNGMSGSAGGDLDVDSAIRTLADKALCRWPSYPTGVVPTHSMGMTNGHGQDYASRGAVCGSVGSSDSSSSGGCGGGTGSSSQNNHRQHKHTPVRPGGTGFRKGAGSGRSSPLRSRRPKDGGGEGDGEEGVLQGSWLGEGSNTSPEVAVAPSGEGEGNLDVDVGGELDSAISSSEEGCSASPLLLAPTRTTSMRNSSTSKAEAKNAKQRKLLDQAALQLELTKCELNWKARQCAALQCKLSDVRDKRAEERRHLQARERELEEERDSMLRDLAEAAALQVEQAMPSVATDPLLTVAIKHQYCQTTPLTDDPGFSSAATSSTSGVDPAERKCGVCQGPFVRPTVMVPCGHSFCADCVPPASEGNPCVCPGCFQEVAMLVDNLALV